MKRNVLIVLVVFLVLLLGGGIWVRKISIPSDETEVLPTPTVALPTISDAVEVDLMIRKDRPAVVLSIKGIPSDVESIEYELTYITGAGLPRGVLGKIRLSGETYVTRDDIVLGTCSSGKCVYDVGVTSVDLSLKFNTASGNRVFQKTYSL